MWFLLKWCILKLSLKEECWVKLTDIYLHYVNQIFCKHLNTSLRECEDLDLDCMILFSITDKAKRHACLSYRMDQHRLRKCNHTRIHCTSLYIFHHCDTGYHSCYNVQDSLVQLLVLSLLSLPDQGPFHSIVMNECILKIPFAWMLFHLKINL